MIEQSVDIPGRDGPIATYIVHPERGGAHPIVVFLMDAPGIREELRDMCRRIAATGYYVMLPALYHRQGVVENLDLSAMPEAQIRERWQALMNTLTIPLVMADCEAILDFADRDPAASNGPAGAVGYCMSGPYAINLAAVHPERVAAAASIHGVRLVTDGPDSPHLVARKAKAELYFGCAEIDDHAPLEMVQVLETTLKADKVRAEVELYPDARHGFVFPSRPAFHKPSAERHWERLLDLFARNLRQRVTRI